MAISAEELVNAVREIARLNAEIWAEFRRGGVHSPRIEPLTEQSLALRRNVVDRAGRKTRLVAVEEMLRRGVATGEISRSLGPMDQYVKDLPSVAHYESWYATRLEGAIKREVLVWKGDEDFEVRYYSMTSGGSHSRQVSLDRYPTLEEALEGAGEVRSRHG